MAMLQRQVGKLLKRSADDANVAQIILDVKNYDERLDKIIDGLAKWQQSVNQLLIHQRAISNEFLVLYKPIPGERAAIDPGRQSRGEEWCAATADMKEELMKQTADLTRVLEQANSVKASLKPVKKVLEKRENSKLDYERYNSNAEAGRKKAAKSEREQGVLNKSERQLEQATKIYADLDDHIKQYVPPILDAVAAYIPFILYAMEKISYAFISHKYTIIYQFAERHGLSDYQNFEEEWRQYFTPVKEETESMKILQHGKAVHRPMELQPTPSADQKTGPRGLFARKQSNKSESEMPTLTKIRSTEPPAYAENDPGSRPSSRPGSRPGSRPMSRQQSASGFESQAPPRPIPRKSSSTIWSKPSDGSVGAVRPAAQKIQSSASIRSFQQDDRGSGTNTPTGYRNGLSSKASSASLAAAAAAAAQKKKPPPIPVKSKPPLPKPRDTFVVAMYDYDPQNAGDLPFKEGDRIKVVNKTDNIEDWWEGECVQRDGKTLRGFFPANYCQVE